LSPLLWVVLSALMVSLSRLPLHLGFLVFVGWIPLLHFLFQKRVKLWAAAAIFSAIYIGIVYNWIAEVTPVGLVGIAIIFFLHYWLVFYMIRKVGTAIPGLKYVIFVAVLLSFEYLQNFTEMRFPWFHNAYSLADYTWLIQAADLGGVILLSALILLINVLIYRAVQGKLKYMAWVMLILVIWNIYGIWCVNKLPLSMVDTKISVMQPSIEQDKKWDQAFYLDILQRYDKLCAKAAADSTRLLIFPEAAMPVYLLYDPLSMHSLQRYCSAYNLEIFTGFPHFTPAPPEHVNDEYFYNAAALFKPNGQRSNLYYKNILVPVGERMLWLKQFPVLWKLQFDQANWEFGKNLEWIDSSEGEFSPSICYELAFANIHQRMAIPQDPQTKSLRKTDFLVNITNDAWFGTSYGPWLHAAMVKFRAVENRIQIYRSANTGISMIVDPRGIIIAKAELFEKTNITAPLFKCSRIPLYRHIAWYPILFVVVAVGLFGISMFIGNKEK